MTVIVVVRAGGGIRTVYSDALRLAVLGRATIRRASHVEPDEFGRWRAHLSPVGGPCLGPFELRSAALDAETTWLGERLSDLPID